MPQVEKPGNENTDLPKPPDLESGQPSNVILFGDQIVGGPNVTSEHAMQAIYELREDDSSSAG